MNTAVLHLGDIDFAVSSCGHGIDRGMSYNLTVQCGCVVYVSCDPKTGLAHARVIERKGDQCRVRTHAIGVRLYLWELLPEPECRATLSGSPSGGPERPALRKGPKPPTIRFDRA